MYSNMKIREHLIHNANSLICKNNIYDNNLLIINNNNINNKKNNNNNSDLKNNFINNFIKKEKIDNRYILFINN